LHDATNEMWKEVVFMLSKNALDSEGMICRVSWGQKTVVKAADMYVVAVNGKNPLVSPDGNLALDRVFLRVSISRHTITYFVRLRHIRDASPEFGQRSRLAHAFENGR
jgi:hypothetical protein